MERAVVIGGGMAGMLAAQAAAGRYRHVVVVERDRLPDTPQPRRGVPQARQLHALLVRGLHAMDELFPGLLHDLRAAGAVPFDAQADVAWYLDSRRLASAPSDITCFGLSRPLLDHAVHRRVSALAGVEIVQETEVRGLVQRSGVVTGVRVGRARDAGQAEREIDADLVIDAGGRASRSLDWLEEIGHPRPPQSRVAADVVYLTRRYRTGSNPPRAVVVPWPGSPRGAAVVHEENQQIALVLFGLLGVDPPADDAGMLAYAEMLGSDEIVSLVRDGVPVGEPVKMRYPASVRQHPERSAAPPPGFLLLGDALASFNPTYGQGITTAALQARLLQNLLADGADRLPERFYPLAAKIINDAWEASTGSDLRFPEVEGPRSPLSGLVNRYLDRFRAAAAMDPRLARDFLRVSNMLAPAHSLLSPKQAFRVLTTKS
ncbi:NAD(P)/FAD-dependent oxidoreductase [Streptomyces olivaceus]